MPIDEIDKKIINILYNDCRTSYESISRKIGISSVASRNRVLNLIESHIIDRFLVMAEPNMIDIYYSFAFIRTDGTESKQSLFAKFSKKSSILQAYSVASGLGGLYILTIGFTTPEELQAVGIFLRELKSVLSVDIDITIHNRGKKITLTKTQKIILKYLIENPRMSVSDIATVSGISTRRVNTALESLEDGDGVKFSIIFNPDVDNLTEVFLKIEWHPDKTDATKVVDILKEIRPLEFWISYISSLKPVMYARFIVSKLKVIDWLIDELLEYDEIKFVSSFVCYSNILFNIPGEKKLIEMVNL